VVIRPLRAGDAGEALTVQFAAYLAEGRRYGAWDLPPLVETAESIRRDIESGMPAIGAWLGTRLAGSVRGRVEGDRMEIARLAVAPDLQGLGVGRRLLRAVCGVSPATVGTLWLLTGAESDANLRLYEHEGFVRVSESEDPRGIPVVVLERPSR
jgi:ribosomal protein S18 acetylase RimI-like enzyme